jgi:dCTP deaminase
MSILSDKGIRARCLVPTHRYVTPNQHRMYFALVDGKLYNVENGALFTPIGNTAGWLDNTDVHKLTDSQVAGYCTKYPRMIEPFAPELVRTKQVITVDVETDCSVPLDRPDLIDAMPDPLSVTATEEKIVSYGLSSYGYDVRCADEFKIFTNINSTVIDPKAFDEKSFVDFKGPVCIIPPNSFALARTLERFKIPRDVLTVCLGKSTYARCGIIVNVTPFEPEWEGYVTLEFSNTTPLPAKIYANEGVAQVLFFKADEVCETSYKDRGGKYQGQGAEPVCPKV